jgi:hypothetical protein
VRSSEEGGLHRHPARRVDHDADGLSHGIRIPRGEGRVVGECRAGTDEHRIRFDASSVDVGPRLRSGDPSRCPIGRRDATVESGRKLEGQRCTARTAVFEVGRDQVGDLALSDAGGDVDPSLLQVGDPLPGDAPIRVLQANDDALHARIRDRRSAGARMASVVARLQRHVHRGAVGVDTVERPRLGVRGAAPLVPAGADHLVVAHDHGTDAGVRRNVRGAARELDRPAHVFEICFAHASPRDLEAREAAPTPSMDASASEASSPIRTSRWCGSPSVPVSHRINPRLAAGGSQTLTAGRDSHPAPKRSYVVASMIPPRRPT